METGKIGGFFSGWFGGTPPRCFGRSEESLAAAQQTCQAMADNLRMLKQDKQSMDLQTAAELDDLYRTKINLEERLVELIRYRHLCVLTSSSYEHIALS